MIPSSILKKQPSRISVGFFRKFLFFEMWYVSGELVPEFAEESNKMIK